MSPIAMPLILNPRVWVLAERLYLHTHGEDKFLELLSEYDIQYKEFDYKKEFARTKGKYTFMSEENYSFAEFMQLVPSYKYLPILERIVFNKEIIASQSDNWNYYGESIKKWYPEFLDLLKLAGIETKQKEKQLTYTEEEETAELVKSLDFAAQPFGDIFIDYIRRELNEAYAHRHYLATMFLTRKTLECVLIRILEVVFPKLVNKEYCESNHELWYDKSRGKYQSFEVLLDNVREKAISFHEDKDLVLEFVSLVKPLKNETNMCVHLDYKIPDEAYVRQWKIPHLLTIASRLFKKYCNP